MVAGALVALILGLFAITYFVDQVIVGVVLNVLVVGLTNFLFRQVLTPNAESLNSPDRFRAVPIPILGDIPLIGPIFFRQTAARLPALRRRRDRGVRASTAPAGACGSAPSASTPRPPTPSASRSTAPATARSCSPARSRASAAPTSASSRSRGFNREMTGGAGYIALAAVIFGKWDPIRATLAALLFGFATNLQGVLSAIGSPVPSQFMLMLPYLVTIFAVAGLVGRSRPPAADGVPYKKQ